MNAIEAIRKRKCIRGFLEKPVSRKDIVRLLDIARMAPSSHNMQPWEVAVVTGEALEKLKNALLDALHNRAHRHFDYNYMAKELPNHLKANGDTCNQIVFEYRGIDPKNWSQLAPHLEENLKFFDAPAELVIMTESGIGEGAFIDIGAFSQSLYLAALDLGLGTCPQVSVSQYADITHSVLNIPENKLILFGIALGYPDESAFLNKMPRMPRMPVDKFTIFFE